MGGARFNLSDGLLLKVNRSRTFSTARPRTRRRCLLTLTPIDEALLLGDVHVSDDVGFGPTSL